jgi:hypothetical protein
VRGLEGAPEEEFDVLRLLAELRQQRQILLNLTLKIMQRCRADCPYRCDDTCLLVRWALRSL